MLVSRARFLWLSVCLLYLYISTAIHIRGLSDRVGGRVGSYSEYIYKGGTLAGWTLKGSGGYGGP